MLRSPLHRRIFVQLVVIARACQILADTGKDLGRLHKACRGDMFEQLNTMTIFTRTAVAESKLVVRLCIVEWRIAAQRMVVQSALQKA